MICSHSDCNAGGIAIPYLGQVFWFVKSIQGGFTGKAKQRNARAERAEQGSWPVSELCPAVAGRDIPPGGVGHPRNTAGIAAAEEPCSSSFAEDGFEWWTNRYAALISEPGFGAYARARLGTFSRAPSLTSRRTPDAFALGRPTRPLSGEGVAQKEF